VSAVSPDERGIKTGAGHEKQMVKPKHNHSVFVFLFLFLFFFTHA